MPACAWLRIMVVHPDFTRAHAHAVAAQTRSACRHGGHHGLHHDGLHPLAEPGVAARLCSPVGAGLCGRVAGGIAGGLRGLADRAEDHAGDPEAGEFAALSSLARSAPVSVVTPAAGGASAWGAFSSGDAARGG